MMFLYDTNGSCLMKRDNALEVRSATVWIDLINPTSDEEAAIEKVLEIDVPTRAEMREIEASNRFYTENNAQFMTAFVVHGADADKVITSNVTFILSGNRLITVRYSEPKAFAIFSDRACRALDHCQSGAGIMTGLLETIIQRQADLIEKLQDGVEMLAPKIFDRTNGDTAMSRDLGNMLKTVGHLGDITSRATESATSLHRTLLHFAEAVRERGEDAKLKARIEGADRDIVSLGEHLRFVSGRTGFLLDATLGMISTEQNQIIKLFSVMAVMLMPPTLVASIYGMNFKHMPELDLPFGYPMAIAMMLISGLVPYLYFKRKGWL